MAAMAVIGAAGALPMAPMAAATPFGGEEDPGQEAGVEIERNNEIEQSIEQEQEACANEAEAEVSDDDGVDIGGENEAEVGQFNFCDIEQSQTATNTGAIVDESTNDFDIDQILANIGLSVDDI